MRSYGPNRYICSVLDEMRSCYKTLNFGALQGLIEEAQSMANRMEAAIHDKGDIESLQAERAKLKAEVEALRALTGKKDE